jgi:polysaccharide biosynthesis protein PelB
LQTPSSYSVAPGDATRQSILARGALVGVVGVALVALALVFPKNDLLSRLRSDKEVGDRELTIAYLRNLVRTEQRDVGLQLLLTEKLIESGNLSEATQVLALAQELASKDEKTLEQWNALDTQIAWRVYRQARDAVEKSDSTADAQNVERLRSALELRLQAQLARMGSADAGFALLTQTRDIGATALTRQVLQSIAKLKNASLADLLRAGREALALGYFDESAALYFAAQYRTLDAEARRSAVMTGVKVLLASGQPQLAYQAALREIGPVPAQDSVLWTLVDLALAGAQPQAAVEHLRALVPSSWDRVTLAQKLEPLQLKKALDVALAGGDLPLALRLAQATLLRNPSDTAALQKTIDIALASGNLPLALQLLQQSLAASPQPAVLKQAIDIAVASGNVELALQLVQQSLAANPQAAVFKQAIGIALASNNLPLALQLTQQSLAAHPEQSAMREQYAQLLEWSGQPAAALAAWLAMMRQSATDSAIANVLRLSPMLYDDDALLAAWLATQSRRALSFEEVERIVGIYEKLGLPQNAISFLEQLTNKGLGASGDRLKTTADLRKVQSLRARMYERSGASAQAIAVLEDMRKKNHALERDDAFRLAYLQLKAGQQEAALLALLAYSPPRTGAVDVSYWDLVADLAYETGRNDTKIAAMRQLLDASQERLQLREYQVERLLRYYIDSANPKEAQVLAQRIYPLARDEALSDSVALTWLDALLQQPERASLQAWMAGMGAAPLTRLLKNPEILSRRASLYTALGDKALAAADYRRALAIRPHTPTRVAYWWLLIDMADTKALRSELAAAGAPARKDPAYLEVQGAAWQVLGEPRKAVGFYQQQTAQAGKSNDFLWLTNYADVLDQAGEAALALRLRRHAFGLLTQALARMDSMKKKDAAQALMARMRLSESFSSGVEKQRLARLLGQWLSGDALPVELRKQADDLVVSWALGSGRDETARRWLWQQHAKQVGSADYAELALALAQGNVQALDRLMEKSAHKFQQIDQLNALRQLAPVQAQRRAQAATLGSEMAQREAEAPRNEELQEALEGDLLKLASRASVATLSRKSDALQQSGVRLAGDIAITPNLRLTLQLQNLNQSSINPAVLATVPAQDREFALGARILTEHGEVSAAVTQRKGVGEITGLVLRLSQQLSARASVQASLQKNQRSDDSALLSVGGVQDRVDVATSYRVSKDLLLGAQGSHSRYRTQYGAYLGRGSSVGLSGTYFLRQDSPDWTVKWGWQRSLTRADGQSDAASVSALGAPGGWVPPSASSFSASIGWDLAQTLDNPEAYSRALRPYGELGVERRTSLGSSQTSGLLRLGIRGTVLGRDQISAGIEIRPSAAGRASREARIQYEWIGDR